MIVGVVKEPSSDERRVALVPVVVPQLIRADIQVLIEAGAGHAAGFPDAEFSEKGASIVADRARVFSQADIMAHVWTPGANPRGGIDDIGLLRRGQTLVGLCDPLVAHDATRAVAERGATLFSLELIPRITRAQSMDVLSSMATIAGYKAVLLAASTLPRMFPMMMTAAGTVAPARVFVVGAGVAGLQAIATARKLGAVVEAYDVRPAVSEQVESLGAKFVELDLETDKAEDAGGYARELGEEFYRRQREMMSRVVADNDVVITTAAVPGKRAPVLITEEMVRGMRTGSLIVDLAAERGGNCELTRPGETVEFAGITILGPLNVPATIPYHASQMFAKNVTTFLSHLIKDGEVALDLSDEITAATMISRGGEVVHEGVRKAMSASEQRSCST
jgi:NAD(P) transhydrogenase subunit alpha